VRVIAIVALVIAVANAAWVFGWSVWLYRRSHPPVDHDFPPEGYSVFTTPENRVR
jgi:hypothetical protein